MKVKSLSAKSPAKKKSKIQTKSSVLKSKKASSVVQKTGKNCDSATSKKPGTPQPGNVCNFC